MLPVLRIKFIAGDVGLAKFFKYVDKRLRAYWDPRDIMIAAMAGLYDGSRIGHMVTSSCNGIWAFDFEDSHIRSGR